MEDNNENDKTSNKCFELQLLDYKSRCYKRTKENRVNVARNAKFKSSLKLFKTSRVGQNVQKLKKKLKDINNGYNTCIPDIYPSDLIEIGNANSSHTHICSYN